MWHQPFQPISMKKCMSPKIRPAPVPIFPAYLSRHFHGYDNYPFGLTRKFAWQQPCAGTGGAEQRLIFEE